MDNQNQKAIDEQLIAKIKKLMALGTSSNEHEAKRATEKAQELLVKHNLTLQQVDGLAKEYKKTPVDTILRYKKEHSYVLDILEKFFFVKASFGKSWNEKASEGNRRRNCYDTHINLIGTPANVEVAHYVYAFLVHTFKELWKAHQKETKKDIRYRTPFMLGLRSGLWDKLEETRYKVQNEMGLVVVKDPALEKHMVEVLKIKGAKAETKNTRDYETELAGMEQGKKIQIAKAVVHESNNSGLSLAYNR